MPLLLQIEAMPISKEEYESCPRNKDLPYESYTNPYIITKFRFDRDIAQEYSIPYSYHSIRFYYNDISCSKGFIREGTVLSYDDLMEVRREFNQISQKIYDQKLRVIRSYRAKKELSASKKKGIEVIYF